MNTLKSNYSYLILKRWRTACVKLVQFLWNFRCNRSKTKLFHILIMHRLRTIRSPMNRNVLAAFRGQVRVTQPIRSTYQITLCSNQTKSLLPNRVFHHSSSSVGNARVRYRKKQWNDSLKGMKNSNTSIVLYNARETAWRCIAARPATPTSSSPSGPSVLSFSRGFQRRARRNN